MSNTFMNAEDIKTTLELFHEQLCAGKTLNELPLKVVDWNSGAGMHFLRNRCRNGNGEDIVKHFKILKLNEKNGKLVLAAAVRNGVNIHMIPLDATIKTTKGKEHDRNTLLNTIIECGGAREYLGLLRSDKTFYGDKKYEVYDYVVSEYKRRGLGKLPNSEVVFGKDFDDEIREENERKKHITKEKMDYLTKQLKEEGIHAIKKLWRMDNGLGVLHYPNVDDIRDYHAFTEALTKVINEAVEKDFEDTFKCARAFSLLYGCSATAHVIPEVVEKAFRKYPMMLKSIERTFIDDAGDREKHDYFFFTRVAVTNPEFDWDEINLAMLPEDGVTVYNEKDEPIVLSLPEQLVELVITSHESGIPGSAIPHEFSHYHHEDIGVVKVLVHWREARKKELQEKESRKPMKKSFVGRLLKMFI